ncbi:Os08g0193650 [Oryza sativa Japonica Group]|uniref:Os08g0193650 protein n=3 Tax=Oryza TaxID=4527 RepID=A0A0P0XCW6_ORYSJ|nr:hypothetical protein DAI22_08g060450 [Oryza sativa Japonica Group]BAT04197.1 Os08g0193650 [Oryza sativa Japonica Group]
MASPSASRRRRDHGKRTRRGGCRSSSSSANLSLPRAPPLSGNPNPSPSSTTRGPAPPPVAVSAGTGGRRRRRWRDWAELPMDAILAVFHKHDHIGILTGAGAAPRRVEAELWRRI